MGIFAKLHRNGRAALAALAALSLGAAPIASAQMNEIDPNTAIDGDLADPPSGSQGNYPPPPPPPPADGAADDGYAQPSVGEESWGEYSAPQDISPYPGAATAGSSASSDTYQEDDLIGAAEACSARAPKGWPG